MLTERHCVSVIFVCTIILFWFFLLHASQLPMIIWALDVCMICRIRHFAHHAAILYILQMMHRSPLEWCVVSGSGWLMHLIPFIIPWHNRLMWCSTIDVIPWFPEEILAFPPGKCWHYENKRHGSWCDCWCGEETSRYMREKQKNKFNVGAHWLKYTIVGKIHND